MTETRKLTPEQHHILKEHGTERPGSSPLNHEKRTWPLHVRRLRRGTVRFQYQI